MSPAAEWIAVFASIVGLVAAPTAASAAEAPERIAVLWLMDEPSPFTLSEGLSLVSKELQTHTRLRMLAPEAVPVDLDALRTCRGDGGCYARRIARAVPAEYGLVLVSTPLQEQVVLGIRVLDLRYRMELGRYGDAVPAERLVAAVQGGLQRAFPPDLYGTAELWVEAEGSNVSLEVDGTPCRLPCRRAGLAPGPHQAAALRAGEVVERRTVDLHPGERSQVRLSAPEPQPARSVWSSPWLWTGIGAGVALAVTSAVLVASSGGQTTCIRTTSQTCP